MEELRKPSCQADRLGIFCFICSISERPLMALKYPQVGLIGDHAVIPLMAECVFLPPTAGYYQ